MGILPAVTDRASSRIVLYGGGALLAAALAYAGWFRKETADAGMLASCAQAEMSMGLFQVAHERAEQALAMEPNNLHALLVDAHCRNNMKDADGARDRYRRALPLCAADPDLNVEVRVALALDALNRNAPKDAKDLFVGIAPPPGAEARVKLAYVRGLAEEAAGETPAAIRSFAAAASETGGAQLDLCINSAERMFALGSRDEAIAALENLSNRLPERVSAAKATYHSAKLKLQAGRADSALEDLGKLREMPRAKLAADLAADLGFWQDKIQRGEIPTEFGNLVLSFPRGKAAPRSGSKDPTQQQSMGTGQTVPESKKE